MIVVDADDDDDDERSGCVLLMIQSRNERPLTEGQRIHHELKRQEEMCTCQRQFHINKIGEGKYCVSCERSRSLLI